MSGQHALLPASGAPVWGHCSGSIMAGKGAPDNWTTETAEGEAAHWVGSEVLTELVNTGHVRPCAELIGDTAPNGAVIDGKMAEGAQTYADDVLSVIMRYGDPTRLLVEQRVRMPQIHAENWGTLDCALVALSRGHIYLWDYKHGHRITPARENLQLIDYVAGLVTHAAIDGGQDQNITVHIRIVQPFAYQASGPVDEWIVKLSDLRGYFNQLTAKADEAFDGPTMSPGKHCRDCPAVSRCDAVKKHLYAFLDYVNQPYIIDAMSGASLAVEYDILGAGMAVMKARAEAVADELHHRISGGAADTGLTLESCPGRLAWTVPAENAIALASQFGADIGKTVALTPTQATQKVPREMRPAFTAVLKTAAARPAGKLNLVPVDGNRAALAFKPEQ